MNSSPYFLIQTIERGLFLPTSVATGDSEAFPLAIWRSGVGSPTPVAVLKIGSSISPESQLLLNVKFPAFSILFSKISRFCYMLLFKDFISQISFLSMLIIPFMINGVNLSPDRLPSYLLVSNDSWFKFLVKRITSGQISYHFLQDFATSFLKRYSVVTF